MHERTVLADRGSIAIGRDYNEYTGEHEHEPEWSLPPEGSGLIRCPRCHRRHIAIEAVACPRCGYPQREMHERELQQRQEMIQRMAFLALVRKIACWLAAGCLWWLIADWRWQISAHQDMPNTVAAICAWIFCTGFTGELFVYGSIWLEGWLLYDLPTLLRRWGIGWLVGE